MTLQMSFLHNMSSQCFAIRLLAIVLGNNLVSFSMLMCFLSYVLFLQLRTIYISVLVTKDMFSVMALTIDLIVILLVLGFELCKG